VTSRDMVPYGVHMVHTWTMEIKEYNVRAHVYGMLALRKKHDR